MSRRQQTCSSEVMLNLAQRELRCETVAILRVRTSVPCDLNPALNPQLPSNCPTWDSISTQSVCLLGEMKPLCKIFKRSFGRAEFGTSFGLCETTWRCPVSVCSNPSKQFCPEDCGQGRQPEPLKLGRRHESWESLCGCRLCMSKP